MDQGSASHFNEHSQAPCKVQTGSRRLCVCVLEARGSGDVRVLNLAYHTRVLLLSLSVTVDAAMHRDGAPDYLDVIEHPMDLGTVLKKLGNSEYPSHEEFAADVRLVFENCREYNDIPVRFGCEEIP